MTKDDQALVKDIEQLVVLVNILPKLKRGGLDDIYHQSRDRIIELLNEFKEYIAHVESVLTDESLSVAAKASVLTAEVGSETDNQEDSLLGGTKKVKYKKASKKVPGRRGRRGDPSNKMSLKEAILNTLSMNPSQWAKYVNDLEPGVDGLRASEIKEVIIGEGLWKSTSASMDNQIQQHLHSLRKDNKIVRGEDKRYRLVTS